MYCVLLYCITYLFTVITIWNIIILTKIKIAIVVGCTCIELVLYCIVL